MSTTQLDVIGGYELLELIDDKNAGTVYKARCISDDAGAVAKDQIVALKVLGKISKSSRAVGAFDQLAAVLIKLNHPNIIQHLDAFKIAVGDELVSPILIMEYAEGPPLSKMIMKNRKGLDGKILAAVIKQSVDAMIFASEKRVLPKLFKKSNVLFDEAGNVKLTGFGSPYFRFNAGTSLIGQDGFYDYMPPEYTTSDNHGDQTSSIFSMGVCFYEASEGKLPFPKIKDQTKNGDNFACFAGAYLNRWNGGPKPQPEFKGKVFSESPELKSWLQHCLRPDRESRYQDFNVLRAGLADVLQQMDPSLVDQEMLTAAASVEKPAPAPAPSGEKKKPKIKTPDLTKSEPVIKKRAQIKTPDLSTVPAVKEPAKIDPTSTDIDDVLAQFEAPVSEDEAATLVTTPPIEEAPAKPATAEPPPSVEKPMEVEPAKPKPARTRPVVEKKKGMSPVVMGGIAVVMIALGGGGAFMFMKKGGTADPGTSTGPGTKPIEVVQNPDTTPDPVEPVTPEPKTGGGTDNGEPVADDPPVGQPSGQPQEVVQKPVAPVSTEPSLPRTGPLIVKAYSTDMEDWHAVVQQVTAAYDEHGDKIRQNASVLAEWEKVINTLATSIGKYIAAQDPISTRLERLNEAEFFLRNDQTANLLGEKALELIQAVEKQKETFVIRLVNQTGDTLSIKVAGVPSPLQVPLNKVKRFMLNVGPHDRDTTFTFKGLTWAPTMTKKIHLVRGGGQELVLSSLVSDEGAVPLTVVVEEVVQGDPPIKIEYQLGSIPEWQSIWKQIDDRVETEVQPGTYKFRFTRLDYEPIIKAVEVYAGARDFVVKGPINTKWVPKPALKKLAMVEAAWEKMDKKALEKELDQPVPTDAFEWKGHKIRMDHARARWLRQSRIKGKDFGRNSFSIKLDLAQPSDGKSKIEAAYRKKGDTRWKPVHPDAKLVPGDYEIQFTRPDYQPIVKQIKAKPGVVTLRIEGPKSGDWKPKLSLKKLQDIEKGMAGTGSQVPGEHVIQSDAGKI